MCLSREASNIRFNWNSLSEFHHQIQPPAYTWQSVSVLANVKVALLAWQFSGWLRSGADFWTAFGCAGPWACGARLWARCVPLPASSPSPCLCQSSSPTSTTSTTGRPTRKRCNHRILITWPAARTCLALWASPIWVSASNSPAEPGL